MMTKRRSLTPLLFLALLLAACLPQEPIRIFITPTPQTQVSGSPVPTFVQTETPLQVAVVATDTATLTETVTLTETPGTVGPTVTFLGSIVQPNYTLPPTSTPQPTDALLPSLTPTVGPSPTPMPTQAAPTAAPVGPQPTALPSFDRNQIGLQVDPYLVQADWDDVIRRMSDLQVGWLKVQIDWSLLQPNGPNEISPDFKRMEIYLETAFNRGLKVMISVAKAPPWARAYKDGFGPPDNPQALADFITLMLNEWQGISAIEIWNEPNLQREWGGKPLTGASYMQLFAPAYQAIRNFSPAIAVVTAGLAPTGDNPGSADDRTYLQQMYSAGLARYTDIAIGVHPYSWGNPPDAQCCDMSQERGWDDDPHFFFADNMRDYRDIMVRNNHSNVQMWGTEFGWATWEGLPGDPPEVWMSYNDKWNQANYTMRAFEIAQATDYIGPMILWNLNFANTALIQNRDERAGYSLVIPGLPERPLYWMIYDAVRPDLQLDRYD